MNHKTVKLLPLTDDFVFKRVFTKDGQEDLLKDFLSAILNIEIKEIQIKNPVMTKDNKEDKQEVLDIRAKINNDTLINIEMQVRDYKNMDKRSLAYTTRVYSEQLNAGDEYTQACRTIAINILDFNFYKRNTYHSISRMKFEEIEKEKYVDMGYETEDEYATKDIEIHYIELPKFKKKNPGVGTKLEQWLWLICGEGEKAEMAKEKNEKVKKASKVLETISEDEQERIHFLSRAMWKMDRQSEYENAKNEGKEEGEKKAKLETAKKMLEEGIGIETIIKITGLTKQEIIN